MKQLKMKFIPISLNLKEIRASLGLDKATGKTKKRNCQSSSKQSKDKEYEGRTFHLDWQVVPYVPTQFPSLHRDVITLDEFAEGMAEVEAEEREREAKEEEEEKKKRGVRHEVVTDSESEDTEDGSEAEGRSEDESSDSEMDEFVVVDDHPDTDKEDEEEREGKGKGDGDGGEKEKPTAKEKMKKELKNLGLSSGEVGESFAVATDGLGKRTRRQTDHLAVRIFQAGDSVKEIDCYDTYDHTEKKFKAAAYHKPGSTKSLWEKPKNPVLAITGSNAGWAKRAMDKKKNREGGSSFLSASLSATLKRVKPGQRPCASIACAADELKKKKKSDIRAYLVR